MNGTSEGEVSKVNGISQDEPVEEVNVVRDGPSSDFDETKLGKSMAKMDRGRVLLGLKPLYPFTLVKNSSRKRAKVSQLFHQTAGTSSGLSGRAASRGFFDGPAI